MIKVVETSRLSVSFTAKKGERTAADLGRVKAALLDWHKSGRAAGGFLAIDIRTSKARSSDVLHSFMHVVSEQEPVVSEFYSSLSEAVIRTVSPSGKIIKKIGFAR